MKIKFYESVDDNLLKFAVIISKSMGKWVFCKHSERDTFEIPGGHREPEESILDTARRELKEETGAIEFNIRPVCVYSVTGKNDVNKSGEETFGMLFFSEIYSFEAELHSEMEKIVFFDSQPAAMTYPLIQPFLIEEFEKRNKMKTDVYECCPIFENDKYLLRFVSEDDCNDLLKVYSDVKAVPFFNSDNCGGDDFHYTTEARMQEAIKYWIWEYEQKGFVRWSIVDKSRKEIIGTIELFHRDEKDYFTDCGLLRLDVRSDYEIETEIHKILSLVLRSTFDMFTCSMIATKIVPEAVERIKAVEKMSFEARDEKLVGHDGTEYGFYYALKEGDWFSN